MAALLLDTINGSSMIYDALDGQLTKQSAEALIQDRYSLRCCPQFLGPLVETLHDIACVLEIEMNSANDNPLIDVDTRKVYCKFKLFSIVYFSVSLPFWDHVLKLSPMFIEVFPIRVFNILDQSCKTNLFEGYFCQR